VRLESTIDSGTYLVRLEDGLVHKDLDANGEDEHAIAAAITAGAGHGER
jgi:hypothetical protein